MSPFIILIEYSMYIIYIIPIIICNPWKPVPIIIILNSEAFCRYKQYFHKVLFYYLFVAITRYGWCYIVLFSNISIILRLQPNLNA